MERRPAGGSVSLYQPLPRKPDTRISAWIQQERRPQVAGSVRGFEPSLRGCLDDVEPVMVLRHAPRLQIVTKHGAARREYAGRAAIARGASLHASLAVAVLLDRRRQAFKGVARPQSSCQEKNSKVRLSLY